MNFTARSVYHPVSFDWSGSVAIVFTPSISGSGGFFRFAVECFGPISLEYGRPK
jgi:hypothetical protein